MKKLVNKHIQSSHVHHSKRDNKKRPLSDSHTKPIRRNENNNISTIPTTITAYFNSIQHLKKKLNMWADNVGHAPSTWSLFSLFSSHCSSKILSYSGQFAPNEFHYHIVRMYGCMLAKCHRCFQWIIDGQSVLIWNTMLREPCTINIW